MKKFATSITQVVQRIHEKAPRVTNGKKLAPSMQRLSLLSKMHAREPHEPQDIKMTKTKSSLVESRSDILLPTERTSPGKRALATEEADLSETQTYWNKTISTPKKAKLFAREAATPLTIA